MTSAPAASPPYEQAIIALGQIGDDSNDVLWRLQREIARVGETPSVTRADQNVGSRVPRRNEVYAAFLREPAAVQSLILLCRHADHAEAVLPDLIRALHDEFGDVRFLAACLGQIQGDRTPAIPVLVKALDDDNPWIVTVAALSLREIGPAASSTMPALRNVLENVRNRVANAIRAKPPFPLANLRIKSGHSDLGRLSSRRRGADGTGIHRSKRGGHVGQIQRRIEQSAVLPRVVSVLPLDQIKWRRRLNSNFFRRA